MPDRYEARCRIHHRVAPPRHGSQEATVTAVERRSVRFDVAIEQDGRTIMRGRHDRSVVDLARFLGKQRGHFRQRQAGLTSFLVEQAEFDT